MIAESFSREQVNEIIKKLSEKSKIYEVFFLNYLSKNVLKNVSVSLDDVVTILRNYSVCGTKFVMSHATARAGGEQAGYGEMISEAIDNCTTNFGGFEKLIKESDAPLTVYTEFLNICKQQLKKPNEKINKGLIVDFLKRAQNHRTCNLFTWLEECIRTFGIESAYLELLKTHGINKKITSFILRDIVWLLNMEKDVQTRDLIYLQPIDTWLKQISFQLWPDLHNKVDELIMAKRIVDKCSELGVSSINFNQGAWCFGSNEVKDGSLLKKYMNNLISQR